MSTRPEGALTPEVLEALLNKHGKVRVYMEYPYGIWCYFVKEQQGPKYYVINREGGKYNLDWNGTCHTMKDWNYIFTNYWLYYAHMLRQGKHEQLLP